MISLLARLCAPPLMRPLFWILMLVALVFALLPQPPHLPIDRLGDKFEHMLAFAALTGAASFGWPRTAWWVTALWLSGFGALIEVLQGIPALHRDSDYHDWVADSAAILAASLVARLLLHWFAPRPALD